MSETDNEPQKGTTDAERDLAPHERAPHERPGNADPDQPETGLISDEQLPEDLRPTDENPVAKNPDEDDDGDTGLRAPQAGGMSDMGNPGAPA